MNAVFAILVNAVVNTVKGMTHETTTCNCVKYFRAQLEPFLTLTSGSNDHKLLHWFTGLHTMKRVVDTWRGLMPATQAHLLANEALLNGWAHAVVLKLNAQRERSDAEQLAYAVWSAVTLSS
jgi:hypothetical protein